MPKAYLLSNSLLFIYVKNLYSLTAYIYYSDITAKSSIVSTLPGAPL